MGNECRGGSKDIGLSDLDHEKLRLKPKPYTTKISSSQIGSPTKYNNRSTLLLDSVGPRSTKYTISSTTDTANLESIGQDSNDIPRTVTMNEDEGETPQKPKYDDRCWIAAFNKYIKKKGPRPGPHPDPDHNWNKHPELYDFGK